MITSCVCPDCGKDGKHIGYHKQLDEFDDEEKYEIWECDECTVQCSLFGHKFTETLMWARDTSGQTHNVNRTLE